MKPNLVLVDDEERILRSLAMLLRPHYNLFATTDAHQALAHVRDHRTHVIISDQRMPLMRGADLLRQVRESSPQTMRLLLTGYSELDAVIASVNEGEVFRFINKPWDSHDLKTTVDEAASIAMGLFAGDAAAPASHSPASPLALPGILVIDDDPEIINAVQDIVGAAQPVYWGASLEQAFEHLAQQTIGVVISDLYVRREPIAIALKMLKAQHPEVVTIVMTPFKDTSILVGLINQGQVFRFLPKPIRRGPLGMNIASALRHHHQLKNTPTLRSAHAVKRVEPSEDQGVATRVMGYLGRLRGRPLTLST